MLMMEVDSSSDLDFGSNQPSPEGVGDSSDSEYTPLIDAIKKSNSLKRKVRISESTPNSRKPKRRKKSATSLKGPSSRRRNPGANKDPEPTDRSPAEGAKGSRKKWACDGCSKTFFSEKTLIRHKEAFPSQHAFPCKECGVMLFRQEALLKHITVKHPSEILPKSGQLFQCRYCSNSYPTLVKLKNHEMLDHVETAKTSQFVCTECGKSFVSEEGFRYHEEYQHGSARKTKLKRNRRQNDEGVSTVTCKICSASYENKAALKAHLKSHHVTKNMELRTGSHQCCICPRSFSSSDGLKYHLATHTGEKRYSCGQCGRRFIKKTHVLEHVATHSDVKYFKCERCPRTFTTYSAYKKHLKMFPGLHSFPCDRCGKVFTKESMLEKHLCVDLESITIDPEVTAQLSEDMIEQYLYMTEEADREAGLKSCYKCFRVFPNLIALQQHQNEHIGKQVYQCRFCPETMQRADAFSTHIRNHLGSTPYMCLQCNRKFISPHTLATHVKNFPGEHSFTCTKCKRWFPSPEWLEKHECILQNSDTFVCACGTELNDWNALVRHAGSKPYKCCICDQSYLTLTPLTRHIKSHTGVKPFCCDTCGKSFRTRTNCLNHEKSHNEASNLECKICNYRTTSQKRLNWHLLKKHDCGPSASNSTLCPICGVLFKSLSLMKKHTEQEHEGSVAIETSRAMKKPQELCTHCGKLLHSRYSLASHIKKVHGPDAPNIDKRISCEVCGEFFRTEKLLEKHKDVHDIPGLRPCSICLENFSTLKDLKKHMKKHDTHKPFACARCGKRFKVAGSLKYHDNICDSGKRRNEEPEPAYEQPEPIFIVPNKWPSRQQVSITTTLT